LKENQVSDTSITSLLQNSISFEIYIFLREMQVFEIIGFVILFALLMLCAACSFGRAPSSGRVKVTRPDEKSVDGYGGARGYDYSYGGQSSFGGSKPFPAGLRTERKKTETHDAYSKDDEDL
jgi:hypothetical protein